MTQLPNPLRAGWLPDKTTDQWLAEVILLCGPNPTGLLDAICETAKSARAALQSSAPPESREAPEEGLDLEMLTDAWLNVLPKGPRILVRQDCAALLAEYARLAAQAQPSGSQR